MKALADPAAQVYLRTGGVRRTSILTAGIAVAAAALLSAAPAWAPSVTSSAVTAEPGVPDGLAGDGHCSLREAIDRANSGAPADCTATSVPGIEAVVTLPAGTYSLTVPGGDEDANATGDLDVTHYIKLVGAGAGTTTIDATGLNDRAIDIQIGVGADISDLKVTGGHVIGNDGPGFYDGGYGGGIQNVSDEPLSLHRVTVTGNRAGDGVDSGTSASAGGGGRGGGVYSSGPLTIEASTITNNTSGDGYQKGNHDGTGGGGGGGA